jgi:septum formation protein
MVGVDRVTSRDHCSDVVSTMSVRRSSLTFVARSTAGPTAARHAKPTLPSDNGVSRSRSTSAPGNACVSGLNQSPNHQITQSPDVVDPIIASVRLILASASPRRAELLRAAGYEFEVVVADVDERAREGETPASYVRRLAAEKSAAVMAALKGCATSEPSETAPVLVAQPFRAADAIIIGADTTVVVDGEILGKPRDDGEAAEMLVRLAGRRHDLLTGVSIRHGAHEVGRVESTAVWFSMLTTEDIAWYVARGEGRDKAGAYAIQGLASRFIPRIDGSYANVVGLPVAAVAELLRSVLASHPETGYSDV